jgi:hypothetical protein
MASYLSMLMLAQLASVLMLAMPATIVLKTPAMQIPVSEGKTISTYQLDIIDAIENEVRINLTYA